MERKSKKTLFIALSLLAAFVIWTLLLTVVDVQPIGAQGTSVGFATLNRFVRDAVGNNLTLYIITDWLGLVPIAVAFAFAMLGLAQWIKRKSFFKVDKSILALGVFYIAVMSVYLLFEFVVINYRPILISGYLEASYPSSTTMLVMTVMPTAIIQLNMRLKGKALRLIFSSLIIAFIAFTVVGRIVSGVHWISDIIGGALFSAGAVLGYYFAVKNIE